MAGRGLGRRPPGAVQYPVGRLKVNLCHEDFHHLVPGAYAHNCLDHAQQVVTIHADFQAFGLESAVD